MPRPYIKDAGIWRQPSQVHINDAGTWRNCREVWIRRLGVWRMVFRRAIQIEINADTADYDLFTAAGSPATAIDIVLMINFGVKVYATGTANAAIYCSSPLPAGSTLTIVNQGRIYGVNGKGGNGGYYGFDAGRGENGGNGGSALKLGCATTINNATGYIFGGGGGGGGGGVAYVGGSWISGPGGGGNPGGDINTGGAYSGFQSAYRPQPGSSAYYEPAAGGVFNGYKDSVGDIPPNGRGGNCIGAGYTGETALNVAVMSGGFSYVAAAGAGGATGKAVDLNGFALTWSGGLNADQVKGAY